MSTIIAEASPVAQQAPPSPRARPVILLILDGFGSREAAPDNAISIAAMPNWNRLLATSPHTTIDASELHVGLPAGQMGNSEVGHLNIGAGRVIYQDFTRIDHAIETGEFERNPVLAAALAAARRNGSAVHVLGLLSPGGVHSHERQIAALVGMASAAGVTRILVHAFLDGRDTPPRSAAASLAFMDGVCAKTAGARIASIVGRYYAMDRDQRWDRVAAAYELLVDGRAPFTAATALAGLDAAYARGENDEFVKATVIPDRDGRAATMADGDVVVFMNFRADRARQMTRAITDPAFAAFPRTRVPKLAAYVCLTSYGDEFAHLPVAFAPQTIRNSFGEFISELGLNQLRIAETEKYAHVTYFFNGGVEAGVPGRGPHTGAVAERGDLRLEAGNERARGHRQAGRSDRVGKVRRHRVQLREQRHGRAHRQPGCRAPGGGSTRRLHRTGGRRCPRCRRRSPDHRRPRQRRDDARPGDRTGAYRAHVEPGAIPVCRPPGDHRRPAARCRTLRRRC